MVEFLDRDRRSNSVLPSRFGLGIKPPRRPNFAQNMHSNKRCRRSLARPNRTTPEYHDVDHGVAVGRPRRFCVIAPIAFVVGMGGWCCWTWCAVVLRVVLRSCAGYFLFIYYYLSHAKSQKENHKNESRRCSKDLRRLASSVLPLSFPSPSDSQRRRRPLLPHPPSELPSIATSTVALPRRRRRRRPPPSSSLTPPPPRQLPSPSVDRTAVLSMILILSILQSTVNPIGIVNSYSQCKD